MKVRIGSHDWRAYAKNEMDLVHYIRLSLDATTFDQTAGQAMSGDIENVHAAFARLIAYLVERGIVQLHDVSTIVCGYDKDKLTQLR